MIEEEASTTLKVLLLIFALILIGTLVYFVRSAFVANFYNEDSVVIISHPTVISVDNP